SLVELSERADGQIEEKPAPRELSGDRVTVLDIYGRLFFAGARTLEQILPAVPSDIEHPVVILRLRGQSTLGATLVDVLREYAERLRSVDGRLYITGVGNEALAHLERIPGFRETD